MAAANVIVPNLGLAQPPIKTSLSMHMYALSSHLVYGFVTETGELYALSNDRLRQKLGYVEAGMIYKILKGSL